MIMAVAEKKETKAAIVRRLLRDPKFKSTGTVPETVDLMHRAGFKQIKAQDVYMVQARKKQKKTVRKISSSKADGRDANGARAHHPSKRQTEIFQADLTIPAGGLVIKLTRQKRKVGTLAVSDTGFMFVKANGKKLPNRELKWEHLARLFESGLLG